MSMQSFDPPSSRAKFERNFHFLAEQMRQGKFRVAPGLSHTIDGIRRVRRLPNGRIDLLTVDEVGRVTANTLMWLIDQDPMGQGPGAPAEEGEQTAPEPSEDEE